MSSENWAGRTAGSRLGTDWGDAGEVGVAFGWSRSARGAGSWLVGPPAVAGPALVRAWPSTRAGAGAEARRTTSGGLGGAGGGESLGKARRNRAVWDARRSERARPEGS